MEYAIKHIVASGCSFTADGIGGIPPSSDSPEGGCSFTFDLDLTARSWVSMISRDLNVSSLINLSSNGHGNMMISNNLMTFLSKIKYNQADTLVLFNLSDPGRLDVMCDWAHSEKSTFCDWPSDILPFTYLSRQSTIIKNIIKHMGIDQVEQCSANAVLGLMSFLKLQKFNFRFMCMSDYQSHQYLGPVINQFKDHMIKLSPGIGMAEFVKKLNLNTVDLFHPDLNGHRRIADTVLKQIIIKDNT